MQKYEYGSKDHIVRQQVELGYAEIVFKSRETTRYHMRLTEAELTTFLDLLGPDRGKVEYFVGQDEVFTAIFPASFLNIGDGSVQDFLARQIYYRTDKEVPVAIYISVNNTEKIKDKYRGYYGIEVVPFSKGVVRIEWSRRHYISILNDMGVLGW